MNANFMTAEDPFFVFKAWLAEAHESEPNDAIAASLATVGDDGMPNVRVVLVKGVGDSGFTFYTNLESAKGRELLGSGKAALNFHWKSLRRQVRLRGPVEQVSDEIADAYYASRPRGSRIGAWASQQSRPMESPQALKQAVADLTDAYGEDDATGKPIARPPHWSGFELTPTYFELWHDRPYRLHDRMVFTRSTPGDAWTRRQLYP
ncbi:MAG: pyridoxamine 5'-phosphate oxidase [Pseudomonadota bacterium]